MIRRGPDNQTGSAGRWLMLAVLMLVLIALLFQPRIERLDGRVLLTIMERDLAQMSTDRNIPEPLRIAARKKVVASRT